MRHRLLFTILAALGSAPLQAAQQPAAVDALVRSTLRLVGRFASAHACPIDAHLALTNGHVIDPRPFDAGVPTMPYAWSDGSGASGFLVPASRPEWARDLATVRPVGDAVFPHPLMVAVMAPKAGDRVYLLGFDWKNRKSAMDDDVIEARVTRIVALHVLFVPAGRPGSSGSCLVNEAGEVVAINEGGYDTDANEVAGLAVGVWGALLKAAPVEER